MVFKKTLIGACWLTFVADPGATEVVDGFDLARQISDVIAAEMICDLPISADRIAAWVVQNVPPEMPEFTRHLRMQVDIWIAESSEMSVIEIAAFCAKTDAMADFLDLKMKED